MRKIGTLILSIIMACFCATTVWAADTKTYELKELDLSIQVPEEYVSFTRETAEDDPNYSKYGLSSAEMQSLMKERNIYLNGWDEDINFEYIITMIDSDIEDFNRFTDSYIEALTSNLGAEYQKYGTIVTKTKLYHQGKEKFLKIYIEQQGENGKVCGLQYYTVYNHKAINVTMQSYSGEIDSDKEAILKEMVDSIHFNTDPPSVGDVDKNNDEKANANVEKFNENENKTSVVDAGEDTASETVSNTVGNKNKEQLDLKAYKYEREKSNFMIIVAIIFFLCVILPGLCLMSKGENVYYRKGTAFGIIAIGYIIFEIIINMYSVSQYGRVITAFGGLVILALPLFLWMTKPKQKECIYYCKKCNATYSSKNLPPQKCMECGTELNLTDFSLVEWKRYSKEEKTKFKEDFARGEKLKTTDVKGKQYKTDTDDVAEAFMNLMEAVAAAPHKNQSLHDEYINDSEYGLTVDKAVVVSNINAQERYLENLRTSSGEKLKWTKDGSYTSEVLVSMVDKFIGKNDDETFEITVFICVHGERNSSKAPYGLITEKEFKSRANAPLTDDAADVGLLRQKLIADLKEIEARKEEEVLFCRKCGAKIPTDSQYCFKCGTAVIR